MSDTEATQLKPGQKNVGKIPDGGGKGTKRGVLPRSFPYEAISIMRLITPLGRRLCGNKIFLSLWNDKEAQVLISPEVGDNCAVC